MSSFIHTLFSGAVPDTDGTYVTDATSLGRLPEAASYLLVQASFTYGSATSPSASTSASTSPSASASASTSPSSSASASASPSASPSFSGSASSSASPSASASPSSSLSASASASASPSASASASSSASTSPSASASASSSASASPSGSASPSPSPGVQSLDLYVQTTLDNEATWCDIMQFSFSVLTARLVQAVNLDAALAPNTTPTDGTMTANTILNGLLGNKIRLKYVVVGDYRDSTLDVVASVR
jgi:hypothetical protein